MFSHGVAVWFDSSIDFVAHVTSDIVGSWFSLTWFMSPHVPSYSYSIWPCTRMQTVNIHETKTHLSRLVEEAAAGEEIVIAKAGRPVAHWPFGAAFSRAEVTAWHIQGAAQCSGRF